ncbi:MAG: DUF3794 domain-containing protein, partial [Oscillospiraceae bacterium]|nr:DUF3794 domain-containing protein [Oscillospiraceae bacterium]
EVRLPEDMPDIGNVLGAWGQVVVRGKEWAADTMSVSCGVMAWVLYTPEEGEGVCSIETWLPFSMKWELPDMQQEGKIQASCLLRNIDARSISNRKMMVRATISANGEAWVNGQAYTTFPGELPDDIRLLTASYPVMLPKETGEKAFVLEEQLPARNGPKLKKILHYCLQPEILEQKVMAGKVVFRGNGVLHILYEGEDGRPYCWDYDLPFSQYGDLEGEYDQDTEVSVYPCVTSLDLQTDQEGNLQLKAGVLAQYLLQARSLLTLAEDAYSPVRQLTLTREPLSLPTVLDQTTRVIHAEQSQQTDVQQVVDVSFYPDFGQTYRTEEGLQQNLPGQFQVLYYTPEGELSAMQSRWEGEWNFNTARENPVSISVMPQGKPQAVAGAGVINLRGDVAVNATVSSGNAMEMLTGLEMGEAEKPDPDRPSLILCRKGNRRMWDIAKETGSTVEKIMEANRLTEEPAEDRILLIPVV